MTQKPNESEVEIDKELANEWVIIIAKENTSETLLDGNKADLLASYYDKGKGRTLDVIAKSIGTKKTRVSQLLRYKKFMDFIKSKTLDITITEKKFHAYWTQVRDSRVTMGRYGAKPEYEKKCFAAIAAMIAAVQPPMKVGKPKKPPRPEDMHSMKQVKAEALRRYEAEIQPPLKSLRRMLRADRSTFAPDLLAAKAIEIDRAFASFESFLAGIGSENGKDTNQGPSDGTATGHGDR